MNFTELLTRAKDNEANAVDEIFAMYRPLLINKAIMDGIFDEDLHQELWLTLINCIRKIKI